MNAQAALSALLMGIAGLLLLVAAWGVVRLPDALARQHAATKAGTLALLFATLGALVAVPEAAWAWRLGALFVFLLLTLPVASHMLARAALRERERAAREEEGTGDEN